MRMIYILYEREKYLEDHTSYGPDQFHHGETGNLKCGTSYVRCSNYLVLYEVFEYQSVYFVRYI